MRTFLVVLWLLASMFILSCGKKPPVVQPTIVRVVETVEVLKPVPTPVAPPAELLAPIIAKVPTFIAPSDPAASSALDAQGERDLRGLLEAYRQWREAVLAYWKTLLAK